jgi:HEAT repeat protein/beta-lactamase regulating signal transducer with metallopeptidase domain
MLSYLVGGPGALDVAGHMPLLAAELLKGTALLLLVFAVALTLRRTAAAARHLLWTLALGAVLLLPWLSATIPWRVEVLPAASAAGESMARTTLAGAPLAQPNARDFGALDGEAAGTLDRRAVGTMKRVAAPRLAHEPAPVGAMAAAWPDVTSPRAIASGAGEAHTEPPATPSRPSVAELLLALWIAGGALLLARLVAGVLYVRRLIGRATIVGDGIWSVELARAATRLGVRRPVQLLRSSEVAMPITCGVLWPKIVLPAIAAEWTAERRRAVLLHELAHVRRHDVLTQMVARVACALYWFHPLVWAAARRLRAESERACDDRVLRAGTHPSEYAEHLLHIVRSVGRARAPVAALPLAQVSEFEGRLIAILEPDARRHALSAVHVLGITLAVALTAIPLAAMGPARRAPASPAEVTASADPAPPSFARRAGERQMAARTEGGYRTSAKDSPLATSPLDTREAAESPRSFEQDSARPLYDQLTKPTVTAESSRAVAPLIATLRDPHPEVRLAVVRALGQLQDPSASPALGGMLRDELATVRSAAAQALGEIEDPRAIEALARALREDADADVRKMAAWALGEIEDKRGVPALLGALSKDRDAEVRKTAARALGEIEDPTAVPGLGAALRDESLEVRRTAVWALGEIEDARAVDYLAPALKDSDAEMRRQAAWALGEIESPRAIDALGAAVKDSDTKVREQATWALGEIEDRRALPFLAAALRDGEVGVRRKAAWAIGELDDLEVAPSALIEALKDSDREVRSQAAHALGELGDSAAVPGLTALARGDDAELRRNAVWALSEIGGPRAMEVLVDMLRDDDPDIRKMAAEALGKHR